MEYSYTDYITPIELTNLKIKSDKFEADRKETIEKMKIASS